MKILSVVISNTSLDKSAMGWRVLNIVRILRLNGHEVDVVHYIPDEKSYQILKTKPYNQTFFVKTSIPIIPVKHLKMLIDRNYDLVYGNTYSGTFSSILGKLTKTPLIYDMHGGLIEEFLLKNKIDIMILPKFLLYKFINFINLQFSNRFICVSKKMIEYLHDQKNIPIEKMAYVTNGADLEFFKPIKDEKVKDIRDKLELEDKFVFGYIGNFQKWQGMENFIEAARKINNREIAFLIVGGEEKSKKNNVIFVPKVPRTQVPYYYSICDVLVLPRLSHPATEIAAPTKFAEYAAMGKPVLTTDVGDAANFVREYKCGIIVEDNKVESLTKGINEFKGKSDDELKIMGKNSRMLAENELNWDKICNNLIAAISNI